MMNTDNTDHEHNYSHPEDSLPVQIPPQSAPESPPVVSINAINPSTAGCSALVTAAMGIPFFAYLYTGDIGRGILATVLFWGAIAAAISTPMMLWGAGEAVGDPELAEATILPAFFLSFLLGGVAWVVGIILISVDVNRCVKRHNAGRGVRYT